MKLYGLKKMLGLNFTYPLDRLYNFIVSTIYLPVVHHFFYISTSTKKNVDAIFNFHLKIYQ